MKTQTAVFGEHEDWLLSQVDRTEFTAGESKTGHVGRVHAESFRWPSAVTAEMVAAAVLLAVSGPAAVLLAAAGAAGWRLSSRSPGRRRRTVSGR